MIPTRRSSAIVPPSAAPRDWWWLGLATLVAVAVHGWIAAYDYHASAFSDSLDYLLMADFYRSAIAGHSLEDASSFYRDTRFPPLFPFLLGLFGGGSEHQHVASIVSNTVAVAAGCLVWFWARRELHSPVIASAIAIATVLLPAWFTLNLTPVSEPLGLLLMMGSFMLLGSAKPTARRVLVASLLVGITPLARTALLPLVAAFLLWLVLVRPLPWRSALAPAALAVTPIAAWSVYRSAIGSTQYVHYLSAETYERASIAWPQAIWEQPLRFVHAFVDGWAPVDPQAWQLVAGWLVLVLAFVGCVVRMRRMHLDAWFLAGYVALILIWPYPDAFTRFISAVYPCVLLCAVSAVRSMAGNSASNAFRFLPAVVLGTAFVATLPAVTRYAHRATLPVDNELLGDKREFEFFNHPTDRDARAAAEITGRSRLLLEEARRFIPEGKCIYGVLPQFTNLYSQRPTFSYPLDLYRQPGDANTRLQRCDYFVVGSWQFSLYDVPSFYPVEKFEGWTRLLLASEMQLDGKSHLVAALFQRIPSDAMEAREEPAHD